MAYLGDLNVSTGVDTSYRPGETPLEYMARIAREGTEYSKFLDSQKLIGPGISKPLFPGAPPPPPPKGSSRNTILLVGAGLLALAFVMLKKPKRRKK